MLASVLWIGVTLANIERNMYQGPTGADSDVQALARIEKAIEGMNETLQDIAKFGAGWRR